MRQTAEQRQDDERLAALVRSRERVGITRAAEGFSVALGRVGQLEYVGFRRPASPAAIAALRRAIRGRAPNGALPKCPPRHDQPAEPTPARSPQPAWWALGDGGTGVWSRIDNTKIIVEAQFYFGGRTIEKGSASDPEAVLDADMLVALVEGCAFSRGAWGG